MYSLTAFYFSDLICLKKRWTCIEHEFNSAPFPLYQLGEAVSSKWRELLGVDGGSWVLDFNGTNLRWCIEPISWDACAKACFDKVVRDPSFFDEIESRVLAYGQELVSLSRRIACSVLRVKTNEELWGYYNEFTQANLSLYAYGVLMPALDFEPPLFSNYLKKYLSTVFPAPQASEAFLVLTNNCAEKGFAKQEEIDLLEIACETNLQKRSELVKAHAENFGWLPWGYIGPYRWNAAYFEEMLPKILELNPAKKLAEFRAHNKVVLEKQRVFEKNLDEEHKRLFAVARKLVFLKPHRKELQTQAYFYIESLLKEISRRLQVSVEETRYLTTSEMKKALLEGKTDVKLLQERRKSCVCVCENGVSTIFVGKKAEELRSQIFEEATPEVNELIGTTACPGFVKGVVKIINAPQEMQKMREGDVLVSVSTNPSLLPAMKKASALVTDKGGLTCHAAIVAREFKIPCVVGTGHASRVFKDGDGIEVDADNAIVRKTS